MLPLPSSSSSSSFPSWSSFVLPSRDSWPLLLWGLVLAAALLAGYAYLLTEQVADGERRRHARPDAATLRLAEQAQQQTRSERQRQLEDLWHPAAAATPPVRR